MSDIEKRAFLDLVRLGIGYKVTTENIEKSDWMTLKALAEHQGLSAVVLDGLNAVYGEGDIVQSSMPQMLRLEWIGEVLQGESTYAYQREVAMDMANLFHRNYIRTYVLKGFIIAECYPHPNHRISADMDCYLAMVDREGYLAQASHEKAWELGNDLIRGKRFDVRTSFYKNSSFNLPGLMVENHQYLTPFRGNERLASFEKVLQSLLLADKNENIIEGTWLYRPPVMVSALFMIEHSYSHFLHEGLTWRMVLDWVLFRKKHKDEIDWSSLSAFVDEFGFRKFYDAYAKMGKYLLGEIRDSDLSKRERRMLKDIWAPLDLHETTEGFKGKLALAGNTWRARWKYRYFTDMNWMKALWIQAKGVLFEKHPTLD